MALLIRGKTICSLCNKVIEEDHSARLFPAFIQNENESCFRFSDGVFHENCIHAHEHGKKAIIKAEEWLSKTGPGRRKCIICNEEIKDPDDYFLIEYLSDDENNSLSEFNYTHIHKSHMKNWKSGGQFIFAANSAIQSGFWKGPYLGLLIKDVEKSG